MPWENSMLTQAPSWERIRLRDAKNPKTLDVDEKLENHYLETSHRVKSLNFYVNLSPVLTQLDSHCTQDTTFGLQDST
jgi:hypothetical protein